MGTSDQQASERLSRAESAPFGDTTTFYPAAELLKAGFCCGFVAYYTFQMVWTKSYKLSPAGTLEF